MLILAPGATLAAEEGRAAVAAADADVTPANFVPDFVKPDYFSPTPSGLTNAPPTPPADF